MERFYLVLIGSTIASLINAQPDVPQIAWEHYSTANSNIPQIYGRQ